MNVPVFEHFTALRAAAVRRLLALCEREPHLHTQRCFSGAIYVWILLHTLILLPYYGPIWGPSSLVHRAAFDPGRWDHWLLRLVQHPELADHTYLFIAGQLLCLGLVLTRTAPRLAAIGVYFFTFNLYHRTGQILDGGNNLVQLLMFYFMVMNVSGAALRCRWAAPRGLLVALSNVAFYMCRIQIALVYLCAGILKLTGPLWQKGMALYYILQSEGYTHPLARDLVLSFPGAAMLATYGTIAFQILFVVLIWWRPARPYLIAAGLGLHLGGIAFGMGLLFFGLVMCLSYVAFLPDRLCARLRGPWTIRDSLHVSCPEARPRLHRLLGLVARLGRRGCLRIGSDLTTRELVATDPVTGATITGPRVLWAMARRIPALLPLLPVAAVAWYLGLAQWLYRRCLGAPPAPPSTPS